MLLFPRRFHIAPAPKTGTPPRRPAPSLAPAPPPGSGDTTHHAPLRNLSRHSTFRLLRHARPTGDRRHVNPRCSRSWKAAPSGKPSRKDVLKLHAQYESAPSSCNPDDAQSYSQLPRHRLTSGLGEALRLSHGPKAGASARPMGRSVNSNWPALPDFGPKPLAYLKEAPTSWSSSSNVPTTKRASRSSKRQGFSVTFRTPCPRRKTSAPTRRPSPPPPPPPSHPPPAPPPPRPPPPRAPPPHVHFTSILETLAGRLRTRRARPLPLPGEPLFFSRPQSGYEIGLPHLRIPGAMPRAAFGHPRPTAACRRSNFRFTTSANFFGGGATARTAAKGANLAWPLLVSLANGRPRWKAKSRLALVLSRERIRAVDKNHTSS